MGKACVVARRAATWCRASRRWASACSTGGLHPRGLRAMAKKRRDQVKVFLMDRARSTRWGTHLRRRGVLGGGSTPSAAPPRSPAKRLTASTTPSSRCSPRRATPSAPGAPLDEKVRDFLRVRGRASHACPAAGHAAERRRPRPRRGLLPSCQPDEAGTAIVDWRKLPRRRPARARIDPRAGPVYRRGIDVRAALAPRFGPSSSPRAGGDDNAPDAAPPDRPVTEGRR